ncbi:LDLR chaperone boca isoform X1 [Lingula anatina]|uniref:LDLR chaperone boca isoform X1 n=1 Tax=Lingula anatina TaxID=7574 RepID=A0A1S3IJX2_LINAN|nr:LDLR chaperone boca isoform X2 [Lingula anatina]XP_023930180.1 LDLR chaperone boca isoform X1 [Lingula anatina]|eukprot:XP_013398508.1 LDLR chaperone boca isoform X2 [Lingula anatina]
MKSLRKRHVQIIIVLIYWYCCLCLANNESGESKKGTKDEKWKKKDIRDYTEADLERLYDQWEEDDEPLEEDELPEYKRPPPQVDMGKLDADDPDGLLRMTKKGRTLMMFATVSGNPTEKETEQITGLWQSSLFNAHLETQRYVVGSNRVLFMLKDGAMSIDVKNFLVSQDRCEEVTIEGKNYPGKGATQDSVGGNTVKDDQKKTDDVNKVKKIKNKGKNDMKDKKKNKSKDKDTKGKDEL